MASIWFKNAESHPQHEAAFSYADLATGSTGVNVFDLSTIPLESTADDKRVFFALLNSEMANGLTFLGQPTRLLVVPQDEQPVAYDATLFTMRFVGNGEAPTINGKVTMKPGQGKAYSAKSLAPSQAPAAQAPAGEQKSTEQSDPKSAKDLGLEIGDVTFTPSE